ncbi:sensor histidine kinase [Amylibacter sp. SFDW26]|uniref:sensor histidine kinase n=1 Tax=Amylibacter sp. SFDW26 TaxID=2652722 RepID=UPI001262A55C|nr:ATP-binding protein [Amylibacter sp. SFDW26]KAB7615627.1 sensor histidine kinase [Amylibacter sp. SFDW26]
MTAKTRLPYSIAYGFFALAIVVGTYTLSYRSGLKQLHQTGQIRIEQSRDRLLGQLSAFRQLPNILAKHPTVQKVLNGSDVPEDINGFLLNTALVSGADDILILDPSARTIATSNFYENDNFIGKSFANTGYVNAAQNGRLGYSYDVRDDQSRKFVFARGVLDNRSLSKGMVVVYVDIAALEFEWRIDDEVIAFFDKSDVAIVTNRPSLALRDISAAQDAPNTNQTFGHTIARFKHGETLPAEALILERYIPQINMTARAFLNTADTKYRALLQASLIALLLALIGLALWALSQRRQRLADLLAIEERANATLEARVEKRTEQLRNTQKQLIEAGKLTALGQMSAGISHELNQPLATMQNFAENGARLIELDRKDEAKGNFEQIKGQVDRMSRIIKSLRAFARKEKETVEAIDLQKVIAESLALSANRCQIEGIDLQITGIKEALFVMGGHVRLQQVVINMLTNGIDAMGEQAEKRILMDLSRTSDQVCLSIRDTGTGLIDPERVFEPFYSTKEAGSSKGMGLGLSISYGIVGSFGGDIECRNHPEGGAEFTIILRPAEREQK